MLIMVIGTFISLLLKALEIGMIFSLLGISIDVFGIILGSYFEWQRSLTEDEVTALSKVFEDPNRRELIKILLRKPKLSLNEIQMEFSNLNMRIGPSTLYRHLHELQKVIRDYEEEVSAGRLVRKYRIDEQYKKFFSRHFEAL